MAVSNIELLAMAVEESGCEEISEAFENDMLLTFAEWKKRGYAIVKGEKAKLQATLWQKSKGKKDEKPEVKTESKTEGNEEKSFSGFFKKKCSFFIPSQVKPLEEKKK